jgi:predicted phosphodiesterase
MKLLLFTDPHRGFNENTSKIHDKVFNGLKGAEFDAVVVSGDWGITQLEHVKKAFKAFRVAFPDKPIVGVLGNHDLWDQKTKSIEFKFQMINKFAQEFNIHLLEKNPFEQNGVVILGFNGWYHYPHPDTRDAEYMTQYVGGETVDNYLRKKADEAIYAIMDYPKDGKKIVVVTHFPCLVEAMDNPQWNGNPQHGEVLKDFSDLVIFGHTHSPVDMVMGKTRVVNVGADYNKLLYKIVEI